jgi:hypothetical protein
MKKNLLFLLALLFILPFSFSQSPFPTENDQQKWEYITWNFWGGSCVKRILKNGNLVPLCSENYIAVFDCDEQEVDCRLIGYYRFQGDSIMTRQMEISWNGAQWIDTIVCNRKEGLMYDFGRQDTAPLHCALSYPGGVTKFWWNYDLIMNYEGIARKTKFMSFNPYPNFPAILYPMRWIEGIGSDIHPFYSFSCIGDHCEQEQQVTKVFRNGNLIYQDSILSFSFPCTGWVGIEEEVSNELSSFSLAPNPARNVIFMETKNPQTQPADLEIYDVTGRLVLKLKGVHPQVPIDIQTLATGLYVGKIQQGDRTKSIKFIKE